MSQDLLDFSVKELVTKAVALVIADIEASAVPLDQRMSADVACSVVQNKLAEVYKDLIGE